MKRKPANSSGAGGSEAYRTPQTRFIISSASGLEAPERKFEPGETVAGRYEVDREIGAGGMCTVYLVSDCSEPGRQIALKCIAGDGNRVKRFRSTHMENAIGTAAGQIWQFLKDKGPSSVAAVKKGTALSPELLNRGIGWLAREGKIHFAKKGKTAILSLTG